MGGRARSDKRCGANYWRHCRALAAQNHAGEIKLRAERKAGEFLGRMEKNRGERGRFQEDRR